MSDKTKFTRPEEGRTIKGAGEQTLAETVYKAAIQALAVSGGEPRWGLVLADETADPQEVLEQIQPWAGVSTEELAIKADRLGLVPVLVLVPRDKCIKGLVALTQATNRKDLD